MKAILRTNDYNEEYKIVTVIKNPIAKDNGLAHVLIDGKEYWTGGILCEYHEATISALNFMKPKQQYDWLRTIKADCTVL